MSEVNQLNIVYWKVLNTPLCCAKVPLGFSSKHTQVDIPDIYMEILAKKQYDRDLTYTAKKIHAYAALIKAAEGCTKEQIDSVTQMLQTFKQTNEQIKKEDKP